MGNDDNTEKMIQAQNLMSTPPEQEPERQYYFIKKAQEIVRKKSEEFGRPLYACIQTFGCQVNTVHEI